jgi:hypothetical protein
VISGYCFLLQHASFAACLCYSHARPWSASAGSRHDARTREAIDNPDLYSSLNESNAGHLQTRTPACRKSKIRLDCNIYLHTIGCPGHHKFTDLHASHGAGGCSSLRLNSPAPGESSGVSGWSSPESEFRCPANGCGVEEFIHPVGGEKAAYYIVECAKHGRKLITMDLQPVTRQNRDPNRRSRRSRDACGVLRV